MIKIFGIGNPLLCDDGVGIKIVEWLERHVKKASPNIITYIAETDYLYCLECINPEDLVIIIDSTYFGIEPGKVSYLSFSESTQFVNSTTTAHELNLHKILRLEYPSLRGYLIGVEISCIDYSFDLSDVLRHKFEAICQEIFDFIMNLSENLS